MATFLIDLVTQVTVEAVDVDDAWGKARQLVRCLWVEHDEEFDSLDFSADHDATLRIQSTPQERE